MNTAQLNFIYSSKTCVSDMDCIMSYIAKDLVLYRVSHGQRPLKCFGK